MVDQPSSSLHMFELTSARNIGQRELRNLLEALHTFMCLVTKGKETASDVREDLEAGNRI